jgi:hypothetical protein
MSRKLIYSAAFVGMASGSYTSSEPFFTKGGNLEKKDEIAAAPSRKASDFASDSAIPLRYHPSLKLRVIKSFGG